MPEYSLYEKYTYPKKVGNTHLQLGVQKCKVSMFLIS